MPSLSVLAELERPLLVQQVETVRSVGPRWWLKVVPEVPLLPETTPWVLAESALLPAELGIPSMPEEMVPLAWPVPPVVLAAEGQAVLDLAGMPPDQVREPVPMWEAALVLRAVPAREAAPIQLLRPVEVAAEHTQGVIPTGLEVMVPMACLP